MQSLGSHLIVELYECDPVAINDCQFVQQTLDEAVDLSGAKRVQSLIHEFNPHGVSGVIVIEESHFTVHTWPEYGYCALDIFTCGHLINNYSALQHILKQFKAKNYSVSEIKRGLLNLPVKLLHKPQSAKEKQSLINLKNNKEENYEKCVSL